MTLKMGELFAGYGGLGMGVERALGQVERAWVSDIDPAPSRILAHQWPEVPNLGDITAIDWANVEPVDILTGGFPCQDVSLAGARKGMGEGTRSGLWSEMARAIDALRPSLVVIENVRGLLSANAGKVNDVEMEPCQICVGDGPGNDLRALGAVLGDLAGLGFDAEWGMLAAAAVGAPHRRERVFVVAWPADADGNVFREYGRGASAQETGQNEGDRPQNPGRVGRHLMPTPRASRGASSTETVAMLPTPEAALAVRGGAQDPAKRRAGGHSVPLADVVHVMPHTDFGDFTPAVERWEQVLGRPAPEPLQAGTRGGRQLSPRFVEWLMGLPEGHVTSPEIGLSRVQQLRALGNGVVPLQAGMAVSELLSRTTTKGEER